MRSSTAFLTGLFASTVLAAPHLVVRQSNDDNDTPDDAVLYSPANGTSVAPGQTFNFTYLADDDNTAAVRLALTQVITLPGRYNTTSGPNGGRLVTAQVTVPATLAPGSYIIGVREYEAAENDGDDDNDGDEDDGDDEDDDRDTPNRPNNGSRIDFDYNFQGPNDVDDDDRPFYINVAAAEATAA